MNKLPDVREFNLGQQEFIIHVGELFSTIGNFFLECVNWNLFSTSGNLFLILRDLF